MPDRRTPFPDADERTTLIEFLDYLRDSVILKLHGLSEEQARTPGVGSGTSLLWLVKHLTRVEIGWFQLAWAGDEADRPSDEIADTDTIDAVVDDYRQACRRSNEIASTGALDGPCARGPRGQPPPSRRWVLVHMVEETARHAGHADILREQIDGTVGR